MALPFVRLGTVGAVVLLVGLVLVGTGFVITAEVEQSELNCNFSPQNNNCLQTEENGQNTTIGAEYVIAGGAMASGIGIFLVLFAMISIMARRAEASPSAPQPPAGWVGGVRIPKSDVPPPQMPPPPGTPPGPW
jgi:hypothetical protein